MSIGAILFMALTWFLVIALNVFSFVRIFGKKNNSAE